MKRAGEKKPFFSFLLLLPFFFCLFACAPLRDPLGPSLRSGAPEPPAPDSLRATLEIRMRGPEGTPPFTARLYAKPYRDYRLDAFGLAPQPVASFVWSEGRWTLLLHERRQVRQGTGDAAVLGPGLPTLPDIHGVLGFLFGRPLPGYLRRDPGSEAWRGDTLFWTWNGAPWRALFHPRTGACQEAMGPAFGLRYGPLARHGERILPGSAELWMEGRAVLSLRIRSREENPAWRRNPFALTVPEGYAAPDP